MWDGVYSQATQVAEPKTVVSDPNRVFKELIKKNGKTHYGTCLVTPFANKGYCFRQYLRGLKRLPTKNMCAVVYDNANSAKRHRDLIKAFSELFPQVLIIVDENPHFTIDNESHYNAIDDRLHFIYGTIFKWLPSCDNVMIVEDDVEVPENTHEKFSSILDMNPKIATVVGMVRERRKIFMDQYRRPNMWKMFEVTNVATNERRVQLESYEKDQELGVELIGSAHTGCWMTRRDAIRRCGTKKIKELRYFDQSWGYRLSKLGFKMVVDWSVKCKHYSKIDGKVSYV